MAKRTPRRMITCPSCGQNKPHEYRGLCASCLRYARIRGQLSDYPTTRRRPEAVFAEIDRSDPDACWIWPGVTDRKNYGYAGKKPAHRWVWEKLVGPIPADKHLDHDCHNTNGYCEGGNSCMHRRCVNPSHLRVVDPGVNSLSSPTASAAVNRMKTECPYGHPYSLENTYRPATGGRVCRICRNRSARECKRRKRAAARQAA